MVCSYFQLIHLRVLDSNTIHSKMIKKTLHAEEKIYIQLDTFTCDLYDALFLLKSNSIQTMLWLLSF